MAESEREPRRNASSRSGFAYIRGRERQAAVKIGGIPEERVGKKRAPASRGKVKERVRMSATRVRQRAGERAHDREQRQSEKGIRREKTGRGNGRGRVRAS